MRSEVHLLVLLLDGTSNPFYVDHLTVRDRESRYGAEHCLAGELALPQAGCEVLVQGQFR